MTSTYHPPSRSFAPSVTALAREQGHEVSSHGEPGPGRRWVGAEVETQVSKSAAFALVCLHAEHIRPQCRMGLIARLWSRQFLENTRTGGRKDNEVENHAINRGPRAGCVIARVRGGIARGSGVSDRLAQTIPSSSTCNDVNLTWASSPGWVSGQYYSGSWITGSAGWKYAPFGSQSPWQVLISNLSNGTWYRLRGQIYNQVFTTAV